MLVASRAFICHFNTGLKDWISLSFLSKTLILIYFVIIKQIQEIALLTKTPIAIFALQSNAELFLAGIYIYIYIYIYNQKVIRKRKDVCVVKSKLYLKTHFSMLQYFSSR